jgi:uncharacterized membrane protein
MMMNQGARTRVRYNNIIKQLVGFFLQGLLYAAPLGLTIYFIYKGFIFIDEILKPYLKQHFHVTFPGLGMVIIVVSIILIGIVGQSVVAQPFKMLVERLIKRTPVLNIIYSFLRDFMEAFVGKEKKFNQPVLVKLGQNPDVERLGFITQTDLTDLGLKDKVAVYLPWSYNFSGELYIVPATSITLVDLPAGEVMKFIISGGVTRV